MRNKGIKIIILGIVITAAVSGILAFYPSIVKPPVDINIKNLHKIKLEESIQKFSSNKSNAFNDSLYFDVCDKIELYKKEQFLKYGEIDYQYKSFIQKYIPVFTAQCDKKFESSVWRDSDLRSISSRIDQLQGMKLCDSKTNIVTGQYKDDLKRIDGVINDYRTAQGVAKNKKFHSVNDAISKIKKAEYYKKLIPLSNCKKLVKDLSSVKINIANSHYYSVKNDVDKLAEYRKMNETEFNALLNKVNSRIKEYNTCRTNNYGTSAKDVSALNAAASKYYQEAKEYFAGPKITVNTKGQWRTMNSPSSEYNAYESFSNYNKGNSTATMTVTIKGQSYFRFYIRSNGEDQFDYVMVGLDQMPTQTSHVKTTKGKANYGTSLFNYESVIINNLNKEQTYTVYIVYKKDSSMNKGTDRGYVLIPKKTK